KNTNFFCYLRKLIVCQSLNRHSHSFLSSSSYILTSIYSFKGRNNTTYQEEKRKEMGRGKIEIKRIENSSNRHVTYSKRRNGILKKAKEISVLCDAHVSVIIFATSGKMHEFSSTPLVDILDQYHKLTGRRLWDAKHEKDNDNKQIELRHLKGEDISSFNCRELMILEDALENGLTRIRDKQNEFFRMMRKKRQLEIASINRNIGEIGEVFEQTTNAFCL
ncbi:hypothetical protein AABB24_034336, partial [Solanum stoloniferum]